MSIAEKEALRGKKIKYVKRETAADPGRVIRLDRNENTAGCSPAVRSFLASAAPDLSFYPDVFADSLRRKLAARHGVAPEQILVGNGSFELINLISQVFLNPGDEVLFPDPSFEFYKVFGELAGGTVIRVPLENHTVPLDRLRATVTEKARIIWICNPNNPTGTALTQKELTAFLEAVPPTVLVAVDEAYLDFMRETPAPDLIPEINRFPNLILLRTFSKVYGLAAARVGYAIADAELIGRLVPWKIPPNTNLPGTLAAEAALEDREFYDAAVDRIRRESPRFYRIFEKLGLSWIPSDANFILFHTGREAAPVVEALARRNILVRGGAEYGYPEWIRVTIGTEGENELFLAALTEILKQPQ